MMELKELQRIPVTTDHLHVVFAYGIIRGIEMMIRDMNYTDAEREQAMRMVYEENIKPTADLVRIILGTDRAIGFEPAFMEFIVYDNDPAQIDYEIANKHWEKEYGRKFLEPKEERD